MPERVEASAAGEGPFDARQLLRDAIDPEPIAEQPPRWTLREFSEALERAADRDEVVRALLRYARDFLEAAALFAATPEGITGIDAVGWKDARPRCRAVRLATDRAGLLAAALATRAPWLGPVTRDPVHERFLASLGRDWPAVALAVPVVVRERVACVLYADNGDAPISTGRIGDLLLAAGAAGSALARVLRRAKAVLAPDASGPPADERGWRVREPAQAPAAHAAPAEPASPDEFQVLGPGRP